MEQFDFYSYVTNNKTTPSSQIASYAKSLLVEVEGDEEETQDDWESTDDEFDNDEFEKEPSKADLKKSPKGLGSFQEKGAQLKTLISKKDELVARLKKNEIDLAQYRKLIGTIPQQIKTLTADIAKMTEVDVEEPVDEAKQ